MKTESQPLIIEIKGNQRLITIGLVVSIAVIPICALITYYAFKSGYTTSLLGVLGGVTGLFFGCYFLFHSSPVFFNKNKVLLRIISGADGRIVSDKISIPFNEIKDINIEHKGLTLRSWLYYDIVIRTTQGKKIRIPTYNVLDAEDFKPYIENYILPFKASSSNFSS
ncbi:hypothetical protein GKZ89_09810 [Bacillus mangrovi]|uniref:Uncharacterized protein n=1 Tax=Metabacillus mangrovi TaxID=1491830 RepID=A0A7X2V555_9BACI|nr:DUF5381 family protein [Metabacillus mangrovi]MTH53698.1 hypothetical protein [Metabacillus mangrovi]